MKRDVAADRQQGADAGAAPRLVGVDPRRHLGLGQGAVGYGLEDAPGKVGQEQDDEGMQSAARQARDGVLLGRERPDIEAPAPQQQEDGPDDQRRAQALLDDHGEHRRHAGAAVRHIDRAQQVSRDARRAAPTVIGSPTAATGTRRWAWRRSPRAARTPRPRPRQASDPLRSRRTSCPVTGFVVSRRQIMVTAITTRPMPMT